MKFSIGQYVNITINEEQCKKLALPWLINPKNPCKVIRHIISKGFKGYYIRDAKGTVKAVPENINALEDATTDK